MTVLRQPGRTVPRRGATVLTMGPPLMADKLLPFREQKLRRGGGGVNSERGNYLRGHLTIRTANPP